MINRQLFQLYARRSLRPGIGIALVALTALILLMNRAPEHELLSTARSAQLERGLVRADLFFLAALVLLPVLVAGAAATFQRCQATERDWMISSPAARTSLTLSIWIGLWCGTLVWLGATLGLAELLAGGAEGSLQLEDSRALTEAEWIADAQLLRWSSDFEPWTKGTQLELSAGVLGSTTTVESFELRVLKARSEAPLSVSQCQAGRHIVLGAELPAGEGTLWFELRTIGDTPSRLLLDSPTLTRFIPAPERSGALHWFLRLALASAVWLALGLGLGAWLSTGSTLLALGAVWALIWLEVGDGASAAGWNLIPGGDLPAALGLVAQGRVPAALPAATWLGNLIGIGIGLALFRSSLGRWRVGK